MKYKRFHASIVFLIIIDVSVRYKLGVVNEKLEVLERQVEYLETCYASLQIGSGGG